MKNNTGFMVKILTAKKILFYGEPSQGKTMLAQFIVKNSNRHIYYHDILNEKDLIYVEEHSNEKEVHIFITNNLDTAVMIYNRYRTDDDIQKIFDLEEHFANTTF